MEAKELRGVKNVASATQDANSRTKTKDRTGKSVGVGAACGNVLS